MRTEGTMTSIKYGRDQYPQQYGIFDPYYCRRPSPELHFRKCRFGIIVIPYIRNQQTDMDKNKHAAFLLQELETEYAPTRNCIKRIAEKHYEFKPHPTAMPMGYLTALVSEIPMWISSIARLGEIDLATYPHADIKTSDEMVSHLEEKCP